MRKIHVYLSVSILINCSNNKIIYFLDYLSNFFLNYSSIKITERQSNQNTRNTSFHYIEK